MNIQKISGWNWKNNNSLSSFSNLQNKDQIESLKAQAMLCVDWKLCWFFKCFSVLNIHFSLATWKLIAWSHAWKLIMFDVVDDKKNQSFCWNYNSCTGFFQEKFFLFLVMIHCFVWVHFAIIIRTYREVFHKTGEVTGECLADRKPWNECGITEAAAGGALKKSALENFGNFTKTPCVGVSFW